MTNFKVCSIFDTETTTLAIEDSRVSFACLYIVNDLRNVDISSYKPNVNDDIRFFNHSTKMIDYLEDLIQWGIDRDIVPIVCAYNLGFDMQTIIFELNKLYGLQALAQSSTNYYTLDVMSSDSKPILRFWDTFFLEMGGLAAMGRTCGLEKAKGYWDYNLIRGQDTVLTEDELHYASRDVQVIPAYLNWILKANEHVKEKDLGVRLLTKTSLVRILGSRVIGKLKNKEGKTTFSHFRALCNNEREKSYMQYALRKACFRGGLTFTAGNYASELFNNVASFDVVSMHHTFINGRTIPVNFKPENTSRLKQALDRIKNVDLKYILSNYHEPFPIAFNMSMQFNNVTPKPNTVFDNAGIFTVPQSKFNKINSSVENFEATDVRNLMLENAYRKKISDSYGTATFAFGKLVSGTNVVLNFTEIEFWIFTQIYDYDSVQPIYGEISTNFRKPPSYVSLQSNLLFEQKSAVKKVLGKYTEGKPYPNFDDLLLLPEGLQKELSSGLCDRDFLESYYTSTVKGMFNSVYGTMAQDIRKPDFIVKDGNVEVNENTMPNEKNFNERTPKNVKVLYTYGARIVGGSRLHLILAIMLIDKNLGSKVQILGGDTDSLKIQMNNCSVEDITKALEQLHTACDAGISTAQSYIRENFPQYASDFKDVGHFEYEGTTYTGHVELWNKARISYDGKCHVTLAGIPRPHNTINIETYCDRFIAKHGIEKLPDAIGYNTILLPSMSHYLGSSRPNVSEKFHGTFKDYTGKVCKVDDYKAITIYPNSKEIGSVRMRSNADNVRYLEIIGKKVNTMNKRIEEIDGDIYVYSAEGTEVYHA